MGKDNRFQRYPAYLLEASKISEVVQAMWSKFKKEFSFLRGNFLVLTISYAFFNFGYSLAYPFESPYIESLGASPFLIGIIGSIGSVILCFVRVPGSYIADRYGRRQIIVTMTYGVVLSNLFFILAPNWIFYTIGVIVSNLCLIYQPALEAIEADSLSPEKRGIGYATYRVLPLLPAVFSPLIAGILISQYSVPSGMRIIYSVVFAWGLAAAILRHFLLKETLKKFKRLDLKELKLAFKDSIKEILNAWKFMPKSLVFLVIAILMVAFTDPFFYRFGSLYVLQVIGLTDIEWGAVNTINLTVMLIFGILLGKAIDIFGRKNALIFSFLIFIPATVCFIFSTSFMMLATTYAMFAIASALFGPATQALETDIIPKEKRGRIMGTIGMLYILMNALGSMLGGFLYENIDPKIPFLLCIPLDIFALLLILLKVEEPKKKEV